LPGAQLAKDEWTAFLSTLEKCEKLAPFVVTSGSLPPGVPKDFYARVARIVKARGSKVLADTSGEALSAVLKEGVYLIKPNLRELQEFVDTPLADENAQLRACRRLIEAGSTEIVALTLGERGALLVTGEAAYLARAPEIRPVSTVGPVTVLSVP